MGIYEDYVQTRIKKVDKYIKTSNIEKAVEVMGKLREELTSFKGSGESEDYTNALISYNKKLEDLICDDHKEFAGIPFFDGVYPLN